MRETITAGEAAAILGISTWSVYDLARRKILPHVKIGRRVLLRRSTLLAWLDEQEQASLQQPEPAEKSGGWMPNYQREKRLYATGEGFI
jgi:excisionase family DNA binding protein